MADLREIVLLDKMGLRGLHMPGWRRVSSSVRLLVRRAVVMSAGIPGLSALYRTIYSLHVRYAVRVLKRFPRMRAIYATRGVALGQIVPGVSDIDLVIIGDWNEEQHSAVVTALRRLSSLSPLYDGLLWQSAHSLTTFHSLHETDFYYQGRFEQGRTEWKLIYGDDVVAGLPRVPAERIAGGYYADIRNWWDTFRASLFGSGMTARDVIFRNSIPYKTVGELLNRAAALSGAEPEPSRRAAIRKAIAQSSGDDRAFLERLERSAGSRHLRYDGDIQEDAFRFILRLLERVHAGLGANRCFQSCGGGRMTVDAPASEMPRSRAAEQHAARIVDHVKRNWAGYRAAYLTPAVSSLNLDNLMLSIHVDPSRPPSARQVRALCGIHATARPQQRIALFLLLEHGGYQLDADSRYDFFHLMVCPRTNPDLFTLFGDPGFVLDGEPKIPAEPLPWTEFAQALIDEELTVRRAAIARAGDDRTMPSFELIRNVWRQLQLETIDASVRAGQPLIPLTAPAVLRALESCGVPPAGALEAFRLAYEAEIEGISTDAARLIPEIMPLFAGISQARR